MTKNCFVLPLAILVSTSYGADFTTYIGDQNPYSVSAIATDSAGNTYVTGSRLIESAPALSSNDVFVTKLDATGGIVFTTTFGGKGSDIGSAVAVDLAGNIWVGGTTSSENFPLRNPFQAEMGLANRGGTGFLVELAPDGTIIYSSYFGGLLGASSVAGVGTDEIGNVYVTGATSSSDFPTTPGLPAGTVSANEITPSYGAFITKLDPAGLHILYSALIVGNAVDCQGGSSCFLMQRGTSGVGIAIDAAGDAFIAGNTNTTDLPVTPGGTAGYGAFAAGINAAGNHLAYLTYLGAPDGIVSLGPAQTITATSVAADAAGNAYLTGYTNDPLFPATAGGYQPILNGQPSQSAVPDAFAIKLNPSGKALWATYLGGPGYDQANSISLDSSGDVWLAGVNAAGFPIKASVFNATGAGDFLAELNAAGASLLYSTEFPAGTVGQGVAVDGSGTVHVAGEAGLISTIIPAQPFASPIFGIANAAAGQISGRVAPGELISIFGFGLGPATPVSAAPANGVFPTSLAGVQVLVNGTAIPLLYVSDSQINAELPAPLSSAAGAEVQVGGRLGTLPDFPVAVDPMIPGIFQNPDGSAKAINQDGTLNSSSNPAKAGTIVSIWATGFGNDAGPSHGAVTVGASNWCPYCQINIGGTNETVEYGGAAPGLIDGVMQVNFMVPTQVDAGQSSIELNFYGAPATLYVSP